MAEVEAVCEAFFGKAFLLGDSNEQFKTSFVDKLSQRVAWQKWGGDVL